MLDLAALHEASRTINASVVERWRARDFRGRVISAKWRFGNTTSTWIPLALALLQEELKVGTRFGLIGFGGGLAASFALGTVRHRLETWTDLDRCCRRRGARADAGTLMKRRRKHEDLRRQSVA